MLDDELIDALREIQSGQCDTDGAPLVAIYPWNSGNEIPLVSGQLSFGRKIDVGGIMLDVDLSLVFETALFESGVPQSQQKIGYQGKRYRIEQTITTPGGKIISLACNADSLQR